MATQKTIIKTKNVDLCATFNYAPKDKQVKWGKRVFTKEDIKKGNHRSLKDDGQAIATGLSCHYTFKNDEVEKYLQIYAYINELKKIAQSVLVYVEPQHETDIRIKPESVKADKQEVTVGETVKCSVGYHNPKKQKDIPEKDVPPLTKDNVKWKVKIDRKTERLIIDDEVIRGGEISFKVPEGWAGKEVVLMPYLNSPDISIKVHCSNIPTCGGTWVKPIGNRKYEVLDVFLGRDKSNRIFYTDKDTGENIIIGYSVTPYSFYNDDEGAKTAVKGAIIDTNDNSGRNFLNHDIIGLASNKQFSQQGRVKPISFWYYVFNAKGGEQYDFKLTNGTRNAIYSNNDIIGKYRGMPVNVYPQMDKPVYCSARDIGNIAAGLVAGMHGLMWLEGRVGFDGLQSWQEKSLAFESKGTQYAQRFGYNFGYNVIWMKYQAAVLKRLPSYGGVDARNIKEEVKILYEDDFFIAGR